jgi:hypothetical protein
MTKGIRVGSEKLTGYHQLPANESLAPSSGVSGSVKQNGVNAARLVRVYRRDNGELIGSDVSDSGTGSFSVQLNGFVGSVFVIAFDDTGTSPDFNAAIYDLVVPV